MLQHGTPPLLIAAGCGNIQIIEVLMRKGAEIQALDKVRPRPRGPIRAALRLSGHSKVKVSEQKIVTGCDVDYTINNQLM